MSFVKFDINTEKDMYIMKNEDKIKYKYKEKVYIDEIIEYINNTYAEHYSKNKFQSIEFIIDSGYGTGFCVGNILKYAQRYGRKGKPEDWRKDMMKVIHYAITQLYIHDLENTKLDDIHNDDDR
jgi:hypothetical protein